MPLLLSVILVHVDYVSLVYQGRHQFCRKARGKFSWTSGSCVIGTSWKSGQICIQAAAFDQLNGQDTPVPALSRSE